MSKDTTREQDYFLEIEAEFARLRNTPFVFSARDWSLMQKWYEEGIPLPVVIEALQKAFERKRELGSRRDISSLSYCRGAVRNLWKERQSMRVGAAGDLPEADVAGRLETLIGTLSDSLQGVDGWAEPTIRGVVQRLRDLKPTSVPQVEESLIEIESEMITALAEAMPRKLNEQIRRQIDETPAESDDPAVRERIRRSMTARELRRSLRLPRLTLF